MTRRGLPSTLRTNFRDDIQLLNSGFVRFWAAAGLVAALLLPLALTNFWTGVANQVFIAVIGALALNLLTGTTGQISLGHAGFVAAGAFTVAALITHFEAPFGFVLLAAAIIGAILGILVGLPALRLKGLYLAVSTLAAHFVILVGVGQYQSTISYGSGFTIPSPSIFALEIGSERAWYFFLLPFALGVLLLNLNWLRSAYGRAWMAIRHRDVAAEALGINVALYKLLAIWPWSSSAGSARYWARASARYSSLCCLTSSASLPIRFPSCRALVARPSTCRWACSAWRCCCS